MGIKQTAAKGFKYLLDPNYRFTVDAKKFHKYDAMPDDEYLKRTYKAMLGTELNLEHPKSYNEKLQWLKLYDRRPQYTIMVDKYLVKDYVAGIIGEKYIIPTLGAWDDPDEIDFDALPDQFVLKCNHNSGLGMCICQDKSKLDLTKVREDLRTGLKEDFFLMGREWPYKNVPRKIIAEQFITNGPRGLTDYKVHNFNGVPKFVLVCKDRFQSGGVTQDYFTTSWETLDIRRPTLHPSPEPTPRPEELEEMLALSAKLSHGVPFLRTDFYIVDHQIYFSELTFSPTSGFSPYVPPEWDDVLGAWIDLPPKYSPG